MAEPGTPHPDGPTPESPGPAPRPRAVGTPRPGRDPVALAAWRRVAEQRRRGTDGTDPADPSGPDAPTLGGPLTPASPTDAGRPGPDGPDDDVVASGRRAAPGPDEDPEPGETDAATPPSGLPADEPATPPAGTPAARPEGTDPDGRDDDPDEVPDDVPVPVGGPGGTRVTGTAAPPASPPGPTTPAPRPAPRASARPGPGGRDLPGGGPSLPTRPTGPAPRGGGPVGPARLHDILLGLAGRLDDDALASVREMVAVEDDAEAAELLGGCLVAADVAVTDRERATLGPWFTAARVDADLLAALPSDAEAPDRSGHRFVAEVAGRVPATVLARAADRLPGVLAVQESWRVTPSGSVPGPVPHRVVLVETEEPEDCDHVVHHLAHAVRDLGDTSVEVFAAGAALPAYHRDALAAARPLGAGAVTAGGPVPRPAAASRPLAAGPGGAGRGEDESWRTVADAGAARSTDDAVPSAGGPGTDRWEAVAWPSSPPAPPVAEPSSAWEPSPASSSPAPSAPPGPTPPAPAATPVGGDRQDEPSIDEDLDVTARRIAALWARPVPEDFSAPLEPGSLEPSRLEPRSAWYDDPADPAVEETDRPDGRHGHDADDREPADRHAGGLVDPDAPPPRVNGHDVGPGPAAVDHRGDPDDEPDTAQVRRARHSRGTADDARGGDPVTGDALPTAPRAGAHPVPGADPRFPARPTNGHRHLDDEAPFSREEPDTGPVVWAAPATADPNPEPGAAGGEDDDAETTGAVAPPWAEGPAHVPGDGSGWSPSGPPPGPAAPGPAAPGPVPPRPGSPGPTPPPGGRPAAGRPPAEGPPPAAAGWWSPGPGSGPPAEPAGGWPAESDESVAQLSDRERELLARLHEELAQRERAEAADPFASGGGEPPRPPAPPRRPPPPPRPGPRVNGHGLAEPDQGA